MWRTTLSGLLWNEQIQLTRVLTVQELAGCELPQLLRLLQTKVLHPGEREEFCVIQAEHGSQVDSALSSEDGISVYVCCAASWSVWSAPN